jgi:hypothetical protein
LFGLFWFSRSTSLLRLFSLKTIFVILLIFVKILFMATLLTIDKVWYIFQRLASKHSVQNLDAEDFNNYAVMAHYEHFKNVYGKPSEIEGYETEPQVTDALQPFKANSTIALTSGEGTLPTNYFHIRSVYHTSGSDNIKVKQVSDEEWDYYHDNTIYTPTTADPIFNFKDNTTIRVSPSTITSIEFYYLKRLTSGNDDPSIAMTVTNGVMAYNAGSSRDFSWDDDQIVDIIRLMLSYIAIEVGRNDILEYVNVKEEQQA